MPPKKKARLSFRVASTPAVDNAEVSQLAEKIPSQIKDEGFSPETASDPWTDEQEISLFKGMIRWKPVGWFLEILTACASG